jgi:hypothetical protein
MLITLTFYQHFTNDKEKMKKLSMNFLSEMNDRKESEEEKNCLSKQMC